MYKRRTFLKTATALAAAGMLPANNAWGAADAPEQKKIGIQTYSFRRQLKQDMVGSLKVLKNIGFSHVELYGYEQHNKIGSVLGYLIKVYQKMLDDISLEPNN